jgi:beta-N-acetylhexosaminidase
MELPVDEREYGEIEADDLVPFVRLVESGLAAVMPAHIVYRKVDSKPAGFSEVWLKRILRERLGFDGLVFSDDLSMEGAKAFGDIATRAGAALDAGCDMVLVCNEPQTVDELYRRMHRTMPAVSLARLARLHGRPAAESMIALREDSRYVAALHAVAGLGDESGELPLA